MASKRKKQSSGARNMGSFGTKSVTDSGSKADVGKFDGAQGDPHQNQVQRKLGAR